MSYGQFLVACETIQDRLTAAWADPTQWQGTTEMTPHAAWLTSPTNRAGIAQMVSRNGTILSVNLTYTPRLLETEARYNQSMPGCEATTRRVNNFTNYQMDLEDNIQFEEQIRLVDLPEVCDPERILDEKVQALIDVMDRAVASRLATQSVGLTGGWSSLLPIGNTAGSVNGLQQYVWAYRKSAAAGGNIDPEALGRLKNAMNDSAIPERSPIFGGTEGRTFFNALQIGCCQDTGLDIARALSEFGFAYGYDRRVANALGSQSEMLVLAPRAQQVLYYSWGQLQDRLAPWFGTRGSNYDLRTVNSPRMGIPYDLTLSLDCGVLHILLTATVKVIALPSDMYQVGDHLYGTKGAAQVLIQNPA